MPYTVIDNAEGCSGYAVVKEGETVPVGGGCHALKSDAIIHMVALQSEYMEEEVEDEDEEERQAPNLVAPAFMKASARRGLELHKEGFSGDGLKPQTVADARKMAEGTALSEDKWRRIAPWLARHIGDLDAVQGDEVTPGLVAMLLWGGGSSKSSARRAQDYAERIVAQLDAEGSQRDVVSSDTMATDMTQSDNQVPEAAPEVRHAGWVTRSDDARSIAYTNLEVRALEDKNTLVGYAAVFDSPSEPMPYTEFVRRGAFAKTLNDGADVRLLIDHEGVPLARTKSGTLALEEDERGLRVEAELDPENPDAARVLSAMRRGDLSQMSFAFRTVKDSYNEDRSVRELKEVQLFDVSIVTFPAYEETVAELRSRNQTAIVEVASSILLRKNQVLIAKHKQP